MKRLTAQQLLFTIPPQERARFAYQMRLGTLADVDHWLILTPRGQSARLAARYRQHGHKLYLLVPAAESAPFEAMLAVEPRAQAWQGIASYAVTHTPIDAHEARRAAALFRLPPAELFGHQIMRFDRAAAPPRSARPPDSEEAEAPDAQRRVLPALMAVGAELTALVGVVALGAWTTLKTRI